MGIEMDEDKVVVSRSCGALSGEEKGIGIKDFLGKDGRMGEN
jgi:hypothetical protein